MYTPELHDRVIRPLYRLSRVRGKPMTRVLSEIVQDHLEQSREEIEQYDPAVHDRKPHRRKTD